MTKTIAKDTALAEITLRRYEKPENFKGRDLARKLCLSLGLLQAGDSRDVIVDVLSVVLKAKKELSSEEIEKLVIEERKKHKLPLLGIASSNIRRQLKRLRDILILEKVANNYRMNENASLSELFEEKIERFLIPSITSRIKEYVKKIDEEF
ncbi:MAG: hypothetical protein KKC75_05020 [Nanoarchaeota archaeon]|nr:hypothetical protein [Nanoarchaeota archaeon]MBU1004515.1 hypothetical protein [Nanoarchaeota archaeon]MBU1946065.1 hypothetical protein [Nanoarchaeota archaeon]